MPEYCYEIGWPERVAEVIHSSVKTILNEKSSCNIMLTGGRSAELLYRAWAGLPDFNKLFGVFFYFGDERCVPPENSESNYNLVMRTLFHDGIPGGCAIVRMEAECDDSNAAARSYENILPDNLDILLLSLGLDGHIASLFPKSDALHEICRRVVPTWGVNLPHARLTITPPVFLHAKRIFVLAMGVEKAAVLQQAKLDPLETDSLPARLVLDATWFLNTPPRD